ncbi:class I SAM-dependent methyltransferase [Xanthomarina sp. F2636L]|uniref:class I SAM-dependent methyltransferase n=1 Tax=Xanthomarina sp. F2636L TaxID=2996018 RepID=UPI00225E4681|nr:class I SAM-dependent methyltransferase [Xanthomarina sp. F2636L]MCX7549368.1 class I SAM-dependent methyltransferase [Xanthomarina sp. F2636L]
MKTKYKHTEVIHNLESPKEIVPIVMDLIKPKSVVDIGCGLGTFLYCFKLEGVKKVLGIDGPWINKELLNKYLSDNEFQIKDLEKSFTLEDKYDLVISLEVAEHISEEASEIFVMNLISSGKTILFSAATPFQGGQNHINEQWPTYWEKKFLKHGYIMHDIIRPLIWDNTKIFTWYKQNTFIITPENHQFNFNQPVNSIKNIVHYDLFIDRHNMLNRTILEKNERLKMIESGQLKSISYLKYFLKSIIGQNKINYIKGCLK